MGDQEELLKNIGQVRLRSLVNIILEDIDILVKIIEKYQDINETHNYEVGKPSSIISFKINKYNGLPFIKMLFDHEIFVDTLFTKKSNITLDLFKKFYKYLSPYNFIYILNKSSAYINMDILEYLQFKIYSKKTKEEKFHKLDELFYVDIIYKTY